MKTAQRATAGSLAALAFLAIALAPRAAQAGCPDEKLSQTLFEPSAWMLQPSVLGSAYFPRHGHGPMVGGGLEIVWLAWQSNTPSFGPSHGKIRTSVMELRSVDDSEHSVLYDIGAVVSFEKNASRRFLIPFFGPGIGGVLPSFGHHQMFVEGALGAYLFHTPSFAIDAQGSYALALSSSDALSGPRAQLTLSFSLW